MGKAACGTCHFAPVFNGTVPPYFNDTEAEVLGVPESYDTLHPVLDHDLGRFDSGYPRDKAPFYKYAFKTVTVRNAAITAPYMHNGAIKSLEEVVDFYNRGGGAGMGLDVPHQTLPFDHLTLSEAEQKDLVAFMHALTSTSFDTEKPKSLPAFEQHPAWNQRTVGGRK
jgi:cytochrome c peroxidase